jgi:hypothetical protein
MATSVVRESRVLPTGQIIGRGFVAAHGAILGALYLTLLYAPLQVASALAQGLQGGALFGPAPQTDPTRALVALSLAGLSFVFTVAVFFVFPFVQGGVLGQVRDRLDPSDHAPGRLGVYGKVFYARLLANQGLFMLVLIAVMVPVMCLSFALYFQEMSRAIDAAAEASTPQDTDIQQMNRQLLSHPAMLLGMVMGCLLVSAVGMVYWVANSIVVAEHARVKVSWRKSLHFCRQNFSAVLPVWLVNIGAGVVTSPLSLVGPLGIVMNPWALVGVALVYSALIGYWAVVLAGLSMSLYLARRTPGEHPVPEM